MRPRKNPPAPRPRESRRGAGLIATSMLALALCVCATAAFSLADRLPRQVDRYLLTRPGEAGLYRVTYAEGSTGWLTVNVVNASADSLSYAALLGEGGRSQRRREDQSAEDGEDSPGRRPDGHRVRPPVNDDGSLSPSPLRPSRVRPAAAGGRS